MAVSFFDSKATMPDDSMVANALADAYPLWEELQDYIKENAPNITKEWKHYGKASGWSQKVISKKRNLLFFIPQNGCFRVRVGIVDTETYMEIEELPDYIKKAISTAISYLEGRYIDIDVSRSEQLEIVKIMLKVYFKW